jgi:nitrogen fixation protein NifB
MTTDTLSPDCLIAVATKTGQQIDMHFGHGDKDKREVILRAIADCRALFVARVGGGPASRLREAGIEPVDDYPYGAPEASIAAWLAG